jgi:hypothetical protein
MSTVRRFYIYLVCAVSLQAVTWAVIALLRNLVAGLNPPPKTIAFEMAVILIGLPFYLAHWLWGEWLSRRDVEEGRAVLRRIYLYGMLGGFLGPFQVNAFGFFANLFDLRKGLSPTVYNLTPSQAILFTLPALLVLGLLWLYHYRIVSLSSRAMPEVGHTAAVRRLYVLGFSAAGLTLTSLALIAILRWILAGSPAQTVITTQGGMQLSREVARLLVALPVWLVFWTWAQRLFTGPVEGERASALRKFYLYGAVFAGTMGVVVNATILLAGLLRRLLGLPSQGGASIPLPVMVVLGVVWAYHAYILRRDVEVVGMAPQLVGGRQAGVRRLYYYLVAAIGLAALLVGLSGDVSVIIRSLGVGFGRGLREQLAWFTSAILAGLPVWIIPWWKVERAALASDPTGPDERRSVVRKIYLYFYLFVATMAALSGLVYIVFRLLGNLLGEPPPSLAELGQAISYTLIALGVWLYHGWALRRDTQLNRRDQAGQLASLRVAVVDVSGGSFGEAVLDGLLRELPEVAADLVVAPVPGGESAVDASEIASRLSATGLVIAPWQTLLTGGEKDAQAIAQAITASPSRKLLVPTWKEDWDWAGVERLEAAALVRQVVHAVEQIAAGEEVKPHRPMGVGTIILIVIGALFLLGLVAGPILSFFISYFD